MNNVKCMTILVNEYVRLGCNTYEHVLTPLKNTFFFLLYHLQKKQELPFVLSFTMTKPSHDFSFFEVSTMLMIQSILPQSFSSVVAGSFGMTGACGLQVFMEKMVMFYLVCRTVGSKTWTGGMRDEDSQSHQVETDTNNCSQLNFQYINLFFL